MNLVVKNILEQAKREPRKTHAQIQVVLEAAHMEKAKDEHASSTLSERDILLAAMDDGSGSLFHPSARS